MIEIKLALMLKTSIINAKKVTIEITSISMVTFFISHIDKLALMLII